MTIMSRTWNFTIAISVLMILASLNTQAQDDKKTDYNFESAKNLDIFHSLYNELYLNYVDEINPEKLIKTGIDKMLEGLDPYTVYIPESQIEDIKLMTTGQYGGIGSLIRQDGEYVIITDPYENSPAANAGLIAGDRIIEIDGHSMKGKKSDDVSELMRGEPKTKVKIKVQRMYTDEPLEFTITREEIKLPSVPYYGVVDENIGYIALNSFTNTASKEVQEAFESLKKKNNIESLILDLRGNGGGLLIEAVKICNLFMEAGQEIVSTKGKVKENDRSYKTTAAPIDKDIKIVILVDEMSASASEIVSGSFQDLDRGVIIGHRTYGKGLVQTTRNLVYNGMLKVTTSKYYTPSGRCIQALDYSHRNEDGSVGHVPDSLISKFYTKNKREVYDGGGISPDIVVDDTTYNSLLTQLLLDDVFFKYSVWYRSKHESIDKDPKNFVFTDSDYQDFKDFLIREKFEYKSFSEKSLDDLIKIAKDEQIYNNISTEISNLQAKLQQNKQSDLEKYKSEVIQLIISYIMPRYFYEKGNIFYSINYDKEVKKAIEVLKDEKMYKGILSPSAK
ncbi:MAG: S41 family peptidase [Bacteroidales bacterium]|nr:S41 family peptidase [Bacteroidales bacterium]